MKGLNINPRLLQVPLYIAGKSAEEVREELGLDEVLKLASNENPIGPSPMALAALRDALTEAHRYPGVAERDLRRKLAAHHGSGLTENHFIIGNGATDVLRMNAQAFVFDGGETVMCRVTFPLYGLLTTMFGGRPVKVEPDSTFNLDLEATAAAITPETRIVWFCSPNNPTGLVIKRRWLEGFFERLPQHVVVVLDESYHDYVDDPEAVDGLDFVLQGYPLVAVRSFSKSAGLANLRVGYGITHPELVEYLLHTVLPFNSGGLALLAAAASLDDADYLVRSRSLVHREREFLVERLRRLGLSCLTTQSNFVLVLDVPRGGEALAGQMMRRGIIVRPMGGFGLPGAIRVSVGSREQNERMLSALEEALTVIRMQAR